MNVTDIHVAENKAAIDKNIENKLIRTEILATIDELNQYRLGNVTRESLKITLKELLEKLD